MGFEKKLYDLDLNPPEELWQKLNAALDDLQFESAFKSRLETISQTPEENNWPAIEKKVDAYSIIDNSLRHLEVEPPANNWMQIERSLEADELEIHFASKLKEFSALPPAANWEKISTALDSNIKVTPVIKRRFSFLRIAAAAAIIGLVAWGGIRLFQNNNSASVAGLIPDESNSKPGAITQNSEPANNETENLQTAVPENSAPILISEKRKRVEQSNKIRTTSFVRPVAPSTAHSSSEEIVADINSIQKNKADIIPAAANADEPRYLVYLNNDGSLMKLSKKLADMKCIYTKDGAVSQDALAQLDKQHCDELLKLWQEKLANAPLHASFDPLGLAEILK